MKMKMRTRLIFVEMGLLFLVIVAIGASFRLEAMMKQLDRIEQHVKGAK